MRRSNCEVINAAWIALFLGGAISCAGPGKKAEGAAGEGAGGKEVAEEPGGASDDSATLRTRGPVKASFGPERTSYVAGEPIRVVFEVENTSDDTLAFGVGGDYRGSLLHLRYSWIVTAEKELCNLRKNPPQIFGGLGYGRELARGEKWRDVQVLNPTCGALLEPGKYRVHAVRLLAGSGSKDVPAAWDPECGDTLTPPDTTLDQRPADVTPRCWDLLRSLPAVATEFTIEITPYDRNAIVAELDKLSRFEESDGTATANAGFFYAQWACARLTCDCPPLAGLTDGEWVREVAKRIPETLPSAACPR